MPLSSVDTSNPVTTDVASETGQIYLAPNSSRHVLRSINREFVVHSNPRKHLTRFRLPQKFR